MDFTLLLQQTVPVIPTDNAWLAQFLTVLIPALVPIIVFLLKKAMTLLPSWLLPVLAVILGVALDFINGLVTGGSMGPVWGAVLGAAGIGLREILDQAKKKTLG